LSANLLPKLDAETGKCPILFKDERFDYACGHPQFRFPRLPEYRSRRDEEQESCC
jgi:hypothetical protein